MFRGRAPRALAAAALVSAMGLAGCEGLRENLGMTKNPPDEFRVVSREPLTVPPEFQLRPPEPGAARPQTGTPRDQAQRTVFGMEDTADSDEPYAGAPGMSAGERSLLARAGADKAPEDIRQVVNSETDELYEANRSFVDRLVFWREPESLGEQVDAREEARRLRENLALGQPVTEGETPTIERKSRGLLDGILE